MQSHEYPKVMGELQKALPSASADLDMSHIKLHNKYDSHTAHRALDAPVTEIVRFTAGEGSTIDAIQSVIDRLCGLKIEGYHGAVWGPLVENPESLVMLAGWDSVEAHQEARKNPSAEGAEISAEFRKWAAGTRPTVTHSKLI